MLKNHTFTDPTPNSQSSMNNPDIIHGSSPRTSPPLTFVDSIQVSIENLVKNWSTRQKWHIFFTNSRPSQDLNNRAPWRTHLANFLESAPIHLAALTFLFIDLILTVIELSYSLLSCPPSNKSNTTLQVWCHWGGIAILSLLSGKALALAVGLGGAFFRRPGYVIDGAVVVGALVLEGFLERIGGGLIVVVSLWRIARVIESVFELSDEAIEAQIQGIVCQFEVLREENVKLLVAVAEKDEIIEKLREELDQLRHVM